MTTAKTILDLLSDAPKSADDEFLRDGLVAAKMHMIRLRNSNAKQSQRQPAVAGRNTD